MDQNALKKLVGEYVIKYINDDDMMVGVGTGSTVKYFIDALASIKGRIQGAVSSSEQSTALLKSYGIAVYDLNSVGSLDLYIDGADEIDHNLHMIKGGGAALTREKVIAAASKKFITSTTPLLRPSTNSLAPRIANNPLVTTPTILLIFCSNSTGFKICKLCKSIIQLPLSVVTPSRQTGVPPSLTNSRAT